MTATDWEAYAEKNPMPAADYLRPGQTGRVDAIVRRCVGTVLDVGGADGHIASLVSAAGHQVTVVDISRLRVERARELGLVAHVADAARLPYADGSFDTVILGEIMEHTDNPGIVFAEASRVARERVVCSVPLNGWTDETHQWRISLDHIVDPYREDPTRGEFIVLAWQRGRCWPHGYWRDDVGWNSQFREGQ